MILCGECTTCGELLASCSDVPSRAVTSILYLDSDIYPCDNQKIAGLRLHAVGVASGCAKWLPVAPKVASLYPDRSLPDLLSFIPTSVLFRHLLQLSVVRSHVSCDVLRDGTFAVAMRLLVLYWRLQPIDVLDPELSPRHAVCLLS